MSNVNKIILVGTVTEKPETRFGMENNTSVARFTLSVERPARQDGTIESDFIPIVAFGNNADLTAEKLNQGTLTLVDGRIQVRTVEKDGQREWITEVIASTIKPLPQAGTTATATVAATPTIETPIPITVTPTEPITENPFTSTATTTEDDVPF